MTLLRFDREKPKPLKGKATLGERLDEAEASISSPKKSREDKNEKK
jgi:hypothetical protein